MNVILIASMIIAGVIVFGVLLAAAFRGFNQAVLNEDSAAGVEQSGYNPALTYGYKIPVTADAQAQMKAARKEAARRAALLPRGGNVGIGRANGDQTASAFKGVPNDPISAVKIASFHTWEGLRSGSSFAPGQVRTHADAETAPPTKSAEDPEPGKDYEVIEITDDMTPAEKRKARIANAKAKSAAMKALKESGAIAAEASVSAAPAEFQAEPGPSTAAMLNEPVPGVDYEVIEITDNMEPDEVRKARIANAKARSVAMKAFKAAGGSASPGATATVEAASAQRPSTLTAAESPAAGISIAPPDIIEIKEEMTPDEVRQARIQNAKAKAAYKKALKEAGIDPSAESR